MKELKIKLNEDYKSFRANFNASINGDLVILSGVNGSGKSQLLNIIYGQEGKHHRLGGTMIGQAVLKKIQSTIFLDGQQIDTNNIDFRSFKDNINISELTPSTSQSFINSGNQAWQKYKSDILNPLVAENAEYSDSCIIARKILQDSYGSERFNSKQISEFEFKTTLIENNFIWKSGDKFTNSVGEIFFNHALKVSEMMKDVGRTNFKSTMVEIAPWKTLNDLFTKLKLDYRFKNDYSINGVEINEQPKLYPLNRDGTTKIGEGRALLDLSDGEKTIISLCFASLSGNKFSEKKLLLLDELDSVLNPSLIEMFFTVIDDFFIKQGIMVIMSTHSPATISLSSSFARYYEVFKANQNGSRLLEVSKDDYTELLIANKNFYNKISDQQVRINELEKTIDSTLDILIVTEGKTDWKYLISALKYFHSKNMYLEIQNDHFYRFGSQQDVDDNICGTIEVNELSESKLKNYLTSLKNSREIDNSNSKIRIGIFDSDIDVKLVNDSPKKIFSMKIEPTGISTEFLFSEDEIKTVINKKRLFIGNEFDSRTKRHFKDSYNLGGDSQNLNKAGNRKIIETDVYNDDILNIAIPKDIFAQHIFNELIVVSEESWENFKHIFDFIASHIPKKQPVLSKVPPNLDNV